MEDGMHGVCPPDTIPGVFHKRAQRRRKRSAFVDNPAADRAVNGENLSRLPGAARVPETGRRTERDSLVRRAEWQHAHPCDTMRREAGADEARSWRC